MFLPLYVNVEMSSVEEAAEDGLYDLVDELTEEGSEITRSKLNRVKTWLYSSYHWKRKVPMLVWIQTYQVNYLIRDIVAGLTIGLMLLPQEGVYVSRIKPVLYLCHLYISFEKPLLVQNELVFDQSLNSSLYYARNTVSIYQLE